MALMPFMQIGCEVALLFCAMELLLCEKEKRRLKRYTVK
jgi:hypothetical protein